MSKRFAVALVAAGALVGCGGNGGGGGGGGATLAGTWDLTASTSTTSGTLILDDKSINVSIGGYTFLMHVDGAQADLTWKSTYDGIQTIDVTRTPAALDTGAIPLSMGGDWTFSKSGSQAGCLASLRPSGWTGSCTQVSGSPIVSLYDQSAHATRTQTHDSIFGDLGGDWTVAHDTGGGAHLAVTFAGSSLNVTDYGSADASQPGSGLTLTFTDALASGTLSTGAEFSARRR